MIFASNQKFSVSGMNTPENIAAVLDFGIRLSGHHDIFTRKENRILPAFLDTGSGMYVIGHGRKKDVWNEQPVKWQSFPFDYDPDILARVVSQWLNGQPRPFSEYEGADGLLETGFLCQSVSELNYDEREQLGSDWYNGILCFRPFANFYAK